MFPFDDKNDDVVADVGGGTCVVIIGTQIYNFSTKCFFVITQNSHFSIKK